MHTADLNGTAYDDYGNLEANAVTFHPEGASRGFQCRYPFLDAQTWEACNTNNSRSCWLQYKQAEQDGSRYGYDIFTDCECADLIMYTFDVANKVIYPDGVAKNAILFNSQYPGPMVEACWGDELVITVTNLLPTMGTQVHWHGVRQLHTNDMDGVPVTQCPVARNDSFTYRFMALQYGTTWYHSHYRLQYAEGLEGPIVIHGPASGDYDLATPEPLFMADWVYRSAFEEFDADETSLNVHGGLSDTILLNGKAGKNSHGGQGFSPDDMRAYKIVDAVPGKRQQLRIINGSAGTAFVFSIDGHNLTIIANDLVPVEPYTTGSIVVAIGQRYDVIIDGLDDPVPSGNYWIRTQPADGCNHFRTGVFDSRVPEAAPFDTRTGVLHYDTPLTTYSTLPSTLSATTNFACFDAAAQLALRPVVPWTVDNEPLNEVARSTFYNAHQTANDQTLGRAGNYSHWLLQVDPLVEQRTGSSMHSPFWIDFTNPTLLNLTGAGSDPHYNIIRYPYRAQDGFIYMIIDGALLPGTSQRDLHGNIIPPTAHPMHWHGTDVVILGQDTAAFDPARSPQTWEHANPPRRDTVTAPAGGYVAVAFRPNNPGVWLVHCHIAWHASGGLALQMVVEDEADPGQHIYRAIGRAAVRTLSDGCAAYRRDLARPDLPPMREKDDSGI
ncbi:multicopper oxidase-domain-containing protein [Lasiosphaeria miniovina]|uniref:Multicopper oxidase-domain-containing protein n=1 Tax=Lasiosphaeria miniovina TaxID=1954250 RepID=A0AA40ABW9_9PEZI|nr:multicopper oxidase-domain-containing protein [Lasiosphaeria miniovina]KAK0712929.1 multicopper oxidase-domain-containing protein [Lasiosphaeria miniovina]